MTNVDSQRIREIRDNTKAMAEASSRIANTLADALELYISTRTETQTETQNSNLTFEKADEFELFDREALILLIECQKERIAELLAKDEPQIHGIFREDELSDEDIKELKRQVGLIVEYANKKKDEPQTERSE